MNFTSFLFKAARFFADMRSVGRSIETGDPMPIVRRGANKVWGRKIISKMWWKK